MSLLVAGGGGGGGEGGGGRGGACTCVLGGRWRCMCSPNPHPLHPRCTRKQAAAGLDPLLLLPTMSSHLWCSPPPAPTTTSSVSRLTSTAGTAQDRRRGCGGGTGGRRCLACALAPLCHNLTAPHPAAARAAKCHPQHTIWGAPVGVGKPSQRHVAQQRQLARPADVSVVPFASRVQQDL